MACTISSANSGKGCRGCCLQHELIHILVYMLAGTWYEDFLASWLGGEIQAGLLLLRKYGGSHACRRSIEGSS